MPLLLQELVSPCTPWDPVQVIHVILKVLNTMLPVPLASRPLNLPGDFVLARLVTTPTEDGAEVSIHLVRLVLQEVIRVVRRRKAELVVVQPLKIGATALSRKLRRPRRPRPRRCPSSTTRP